jgi:membrane protein DedA with SNARE-associated domain
MVKILVIGVIVLVLGLGFLVVLRKKKAKSNDDIYPMW